MNRLTSLILTSITCYCLLPNNIVHVKANDGTEAIINKSVDEDIKTFNFDVNRYKIDSKLVYRPILITYIESKSSKFYDLVYFYDPNDEFDLQKANVTIEGKENADSEIKYTYTSIYNLTYAGMSKDKTIKRYFLNTYNVDKLNYKYREYSINTCSTDSYTYTLDNHFLFNQLGELEYNNCVNIRLEDAHAWSWHFDEQLYNKSWWQKFNEFFIQKDTQNILRDQLFYSFYILDDWNIKEIKSMDIEYKKVLLVGKRYNIADTTGKSEMYNPDTEDKYFGPQYYKWNDNNDIDNVDTSNLLGYNISQFGNKVDFTHKTIITEEVSSKGLKHNYTWKTIQDCNQFKTCFGIDSDIYKFANYFFTDSSKKYYIINYDSFFYRYSSDIVAYKDYNYNVIENTKNFCNYLLDNGIVPDRFSSFGDQPMDISYALDFYSFRQEYTFDISVKYITYEDYADVEYTYPVSVASVNQEGSGGTSEKPFTWLDIIKIIFCVVFGLIALIFLWPLLLPIGKIIVYIISIPFKALYKVIKNRGKKNE